MAWTTFFPANWGSAWFSSGTQAGSLTVASLSACAQTVAALETLPVVSA